MPNGAQEKEEGLGGFSRVLDLIRIFCFSRNPLRKTRNTGTRRLRHGGGGYMRWTATWMPCRASFLHVEPFRLKLGFLVLPLAWDGPP
ncbi:hypothetical protein GQ457_02G024160 [Hibiscus cannabinus]